MSRSIQSPWPSARFGEFAVFRNGLNYSASDVGDGLKLIGVSDFQDNLTIDYAHLQRVRGFDHLTADDLLRNNDLLFVRSNGNRALIGRVLFIRDLSERVSHSGFTIKARIASTELDPLFAALFFTSERAKSQIFKHGGGTNISNLSQEILADVRIPLIPLSEQNAIVAILMTWDRGIRQLSDLIAAKLRFKQGLMQQLLNGKRQFPEFRHSPFVDCHVGEVLQETFRPVTWNDDKLYRLASIRRHSGGLFWREALRGKQIKVKKLHSLQEGDFLISHIQAAYGAMGLVPAEFVGGKVSDMYTILTPKSAGTIDMRYIDYLSQMKRMRHQAYLACNGFFAERLRLNFDPAEFMKQKILLPKSKKEQSRIADLLDSLVGELRTLERELDALKTQKKGLMQKLLTGQVRVKS